MLMLLKISLTAFLVGGLAYWSAPTPHRDSQARRFWAYIAALGVLGCFICLIWAIWKI